MKGLYIYALLSQALAWSGSAHIDISWLAWNLMGRTGKRYLRQHLGKDPRDIYRASTWPDSDAAIGKYPESDKLHYSNTPYRDCQSFDLGRDCGRRGSRKCIVTGFTNFAIMASDPSQPDIVRADAIKFLLHLLADMHQPLHTGFSDDFGGNSIHLSQPEMSLHEIWDNGLFNTSIQEKSVPPLENTIQLPRDMSSRENLLQYASEVVSETSTKYTCDYAYTDTTGKYIETNSILSEDYMISRKAIAMDRLRIAGIRLAEFISALAENYFSKVRSPKRVPGSTPKQIEVSNQFAVLEDLLEDAQDSDEAAGIVAPSIIQESVEMIAVVSKIPKHKLDDGTYEIDQFFERPQSVANVNLTDIIFMRIGRMVILSSRSVLDNPIRKKYPAVVSDQVFSIKYTSRGKHRHGHNLDLAVDRDCSFDRRLTVDDVQLILKNHYGERFKYSMAVVEIPFEDPTHFPVLSHEVRASSQPTSLRRYRLWRVGGFRADQVSGALRQMDSRYNDHLDVLRLQVQGASRQNISLQEYWEKNLIRNLQVASAIQIQHTLVFFHRDTFMTPCAPRRFMLFTTVANLDSPFILIDTNLFDGDFTPRLVYTLMRIQELKSERNPASIGTLVPEMFHFFKIYADTGMDRLRNSPFQEIAVYPSPYSDTVAYFQWNLTSEFISKSC
jgi:hypothetical protein